MTNHARSEQLLAAAIDFGLTPAEHTELSDHLASCSTCRALAAAYRADASRLRELAFVEPPASIRAAVLRSAGRPPARAIEPWKLLAAAALLLVSLLAAAAAIGAFNPRPALVLVGPTPRSSSGPVQSQEPGQSPAASPPTIVALDPSTVTWTRIGDAGPSGPIVASDAGYAMLASGPDWAFGDVTDVAFSTDGRQWATSNLAYPVTNCPGYGPPGDEQVNDAVVRAIATNGHAFVAVGEEQPHDAASCANIGASVRPVAWFSADGRTWRRSAPLEVGGDNMRATAVWATPTGWQAAGIDRLWESSDGLTWNNVSGPSAAFSADIAAGTAADGTLVRLDPISGGPFTTRDGQTWAPISDAGGCTAAPGVTQIRGPAEPGLDAWVVLDDTRVCSSRDIATWSSTTMTFALTGLVQTRYGAIVLGDACSGAGATCSPDPRAYLSADGIAWSPLPLPPQAGGWPMGDGPAGVLMIDGTTVWRLDPSTAAAPSPASSGEVPAALKATCDGTGAEISNPIVKSQPDGVHIDIANTSGQSLDFSLDDANGLAIQGDSVPGASGSFTYPFGPASYGFTCNSSTTAFTVVDPDALYVSPELQCTTPASGTTGSTDYGEGARGPRGLLLDVARQELRGLKLGDTVERAGYAQAAGTALVRVVRQGRVVAALGYSGDGQGGWLIAGTQACPESKITVVPPKS